MYSIFQDTSLNEKPRIHDARRNGREGPLESCSPVVMRALAKTSKSNFFRTLEVNQRLARILGSFIQEKWLNCVYMPHFLYSPVDERSGCLHILTTMTSATLNVRVLTPLQDLDFNSSGY